MKPYLDLTGNSGVITYEAYIDFVIIRFIDGAEYLICCHQVWEKHIAQMKKLAKIGSGLSTYISKYVRWE